MVLLPEQYDAWLDGGQSALELVCIHPDADAFEVKPALPTPGDQHGERGR